MHKGNRDRSLSDRRCDSLDVTRANIADSEHSRQTCFEQIRPAGKWPVCAREIFLREIWPGPDETIAIEDDTTAQPGRVRQSPGHDKNMPEVMGFNVLGFLITAVHALQMDLTMASPCCREPAVQDSVPLRAPRVQ